MTRRDRNTVFVLSGMLAVNILTGLVCSLTCVSFRRKIELHAVESLKSCKASEKASIDASASALLLSDMIRDVSLSAPDGAPVSAPVILGYGQTRSAKAIYIYRDVEQDGLVRREFVERIPLAAQN